MSTQGYLIRILEKDNYKCTIKEQKPNNNNESIKKALKLLTKEPGSHSGSAPY